MNIYYALFVDTIKKDIGLKHELETQRWMESQHDDRVEAYRKLKKRGYIKRMMKEKMTIKPRKLIECHHI